MIEINYNGTEYFGRLISIVAVEDEFRDADGVVTYVNKGYDVTFMDAFGAIIYLFLGTLDSIILK